MHNEWVREDTYKEDTCKNRILSCKLDMRLTKGESLREFDPGESISLKIDPTKLLMALKDAADHGTWMFFVTVCYLTENTLIPGIKSGLVEILGKTL